MTEQKKDEPQTLNDEALDGANGGLGDTATHEVGHIAPLPTATPRRYTGTPIDGQGI